MSFVEEGLKRSFIAASTIKKLSLMYSTLVRRTPAFADILLPGSNINLSFLFLNLSSRHEIRSKGEGGTSFSYEIPRPPPRSKNSSEISKLQFVC